MENGPKVTSNQLIVEMHRTVDRLAEDGADRGDIKILARSLRELRHSFRVLSEHKGVRKVTVFGSARSRPESPPYRQAVEFGREMAGKGWMVVTGGGEGIMEAAHVGAGQDLAMGINILLPFEQGPNRIIASDPKLIHVKYFFTRKLLFVKESDGVALFPGGFGTLDEAFEVLTLLQTGKGMLFPIVLLDEPGGNYWRIWREFVEGHLLRRGLISPEDLSLFRVTDTVEEAVEEILGFYRNYHSMRYVGKELVIRISRLLPRHAQSRVRRDFSDILAAGSFRTGSSLPDEENEPHLAALPRLIFRFNRKHFGRLRMLIDFLNREVD
ncbi:MAG: LOG family protein [Candidatus Deferrimicrobiaceae bacterium]